MSTVAPLRVESAPPAGQGSRDFNFQPVVSALRSCPFFAGWSAPPVAALAAVSSLRSFGPGQVVLAEGQKAEHVIAVVRGRLRAVRRADRGREVTLDIFRTGDLCADGLFEADVTLGEDLIAAETCLLAFIPRADLLAQLRGNTDAALSLAGLVNRRLRDARSLSAGLVLDDVEQRLHGLLVRLARVEGEPSAEGTLIRRCPTQQELANMIGACRETVSRIVAELSRQGQVTLRGRRLTLTPAFLSASEREHAA